MDLSYAETELALATKKRDAARTTMNAAKVGTRAWLSAEAELNFWQGKVANLEGAVAGLKGAGPKGGSSKDGARS